MENLGSPEFVRCIFAGNTAALGGAVCLDGSASGSWLAAGCLFAGNRATNSGGAITAFNSGLLELVGCTLTANEAANSGGAVHAVTVGASLKGCIAWGNTAAGAPVEYSQLSLVPGFGAVTYSCVQFGTGSYGGVGNTALDPAFADALGPDGAAGTLDEDYSLTLGSPCIDAGDNAALPADAHDLDGDGELAEPLPLDLAGGPRLVDDLATPDAGSGSAPLVDMGAFEAPSFTGLVGDRTWVSLSQGGTQKLAVYGGTTLADRTYVVLGSTLGTSPGLLLGPLVLPLNADAYTVLGLSLIHI